MINPSQVSNLTPARAWLESLRLRTLPLACASVLTGSALAWRQESFDLAIALMALMTTALLQILANLANDYGDVQKGSDDSNRLGPLRGMQKGIISLRQMQTALAITVIITLLVGLALVVQASQSIRELLIFLMLGALAISAALAYTMGKRPYGYRGLGDISVLVFFGWLAVLGSFWLQTHSLNWITLLPATGCGLLAVAVLNANNMRDIENDRRNGKRTLAVYLGPLNARRYHVLLLLGALLCYALFNLSIIHQWYDWLFMLAAPWLYQQCRYVMENHTPQAMRPMLEKSVKLALLINLLFALGLML